MTKRDEVKILVEDMICEIGGVKEVKEVKEEDTINKKIGIIGLEANDLLYKINERFGTDFSLMDADRYFSETKFFLYPLLKSKAEDITVGHLINVVVYGRWFDP